MTDILTGEILPAAEAGGGTTPTVVDEKNPFVTEKTTTNEVPGSMSGTDPVEVLLREWLIGYGSANTRAAYRRDVAHWLTFLATAGVDPLREARRLHTHAWLRVQEAEGAATATRARRLAAVSAWYAWMIAEELTERANPAAIDPKRKPRVNPDRTTTGGLSREQAVALLTAADVDTAPHAARTAAIVAVLLFTGIRVSELTGADVDQLGHDRGHRVLRFTAKGDADHLVVLPASVTHRLDAYLAGRADLTADQLPVPAAAAGAGHPRQPLFTTGPGGRLDRRAITRLLQRLARDADIPIRMSPHVLRHTCATLARDAGARLEDIQDQLGHADARTTRRYDHGGARLDRAPAYRLTEYLTA